LKEITMTLMRAWAITRIGPIKPGEKPLERVTLPIPTPAPAEVLLRVRYCGVCHTELDEIEGRTAPPVLPTIPGHQVVGEIVALGSGVTQWQVGARVGVAWIFSACGECALCRRGQQNLCAQFVATGRDRHGGYAEYMIADARYCVAIPPTLPDLVVAPLLCAGAIGYRSLRLTLLQNGDALGLTGFGASNHLVLRMARILFPNSPIYVFARSAQQREFALALGADWAGDTWDVPPALCRSILDTTPAWSPIIAALQVLQPGGRVVVNAIRKQSADIAQLATIDYPRHLWLEKEIKSVANVTKQDVEDCLALFAQHADIAPQTQCYAFDDANVAITDLVAGDSVGAKVIAVAGSMG